MRRVDVVWLFLLGPFVFNFAVFVVMGWLGYFTVGTEAFENVGEVLYIYTPLVRIPVMWGFLLFLLRRFRSEGRSIKAVVGLSKASFLRDMALALGLSLLTFLLWNVYAVPWEIILPGFSTYFVTPALTFGYVVLIIAVSVTAGVVEEVIWRGYGIPELREKYRSVGKAVFASSVAWAVLHVNPFHVGITFVLGVVYGYLFVKIGRLAPLILGHFTFDLISFAFPRTLMFLAV